MLNELKFVQGAVSKKTFLPSLNHFRIENGMVRSFNGTLALSSPINLDINCTPKAIPFVKAIQSCRDTVVMKITAAGRLSIKSGSFKAFIECLDEEAPHVAPEGELFDIDGETLLTALKAISPLMGDDASRPWSTGALIKGQSAFATNNVLLIEYWLGKSFPITCNIPRSAIKEMLRINEPPEKAQADTNSISFHYPDGKWIRTALLDAKWPDLSRILDAPCNPSPMNEMLYDGLDSIAPFVDQSQRVFFHQGAVRTSPVDGEGASFEIEDFPHKGAYQLKMLNLIKPLATSIDFTTYPKACIFYGENVRGAIMGMRI